jgi:outer membrane immunogenic protein
MFKLLLSTTAPVAGFLLVCAVAAPASAQKPQGNPPADWWSGWYVGGNAGGSWGDTKLRTSVTPGSGAGALSPADAAAISAASHDTSNKAGFTGGIQGGYNYLYNNAWLFGIEGDFEGMDIRSASTKPVPGTVNPANLYTISQDVTAGWLATIRPRVGYTYNQYLFYGTIGFAWADLKYNASLTSNTALPPLSTSTSTTKTGWAGGIGMAYAWNPHLQFRGEWLYADLGHANAATLNATGASIKPDDNVAANLVRVGVDYRF